MTETQHTFSTLAIKSFLIILTAISIIPLSSSLEISLNSPAEAEIGEEFSVEISADSSETYDVKIFIHNSDDGKINQNEYISEIFDESSQTWKNPYYYINGVFPSQTQFNINALNSPGEREICVRMRLSSNKDAGFEQVCNSITLSGEPEKDTKIESKKEEEKEEPEEENLPPIKGDRTQNKVQQLSTQEPPAIKEPTHRLLLSNNKESKVPKEETTIKVTRTKDYLLYTFMIISLFLVIFIALRKL